MQILLGLIQKYRIINWDILFGGFIGGLLSLWLTRAFFAPPWGSVKDWLVALLLWLGGSLGLLLLSAFLIRPAFHLLTFRQKILVGIFCLALGGLSLTFWKLPLPNLLPFPSQFTVTALSEKNPLSSGNEVSLLGFKVENQFMTYKAFKTNGPWQRVDQTLVAPPYRPADFTWSGQAYRQELVFKAFPQGGKVMVVSGDKSLVVDLYSPVFKPVSIDFNNQPVLTPLCDGLIYLILTGLLAILFICPVILSWQTSAPLEKKEPLPLGELIKKSHWIIWVTIFAGLYLYFVTWHFGAWMDTDSTNYFSAARHLVEGAGYIDTDTAPYVWWPPLYPALLSLLNFPFIVNPLEWARWLNILLFGVTIGGSFYLVINIIPLRSWYLWIIVVLVLVGSRPDANTFTLLLSEPLFIFTITFYFIFLYRYFKNGLTMDALGVTFFAVLTGLTRYVGGVLVGVGVMTALFLLPGNCYKRLARALSFLAASTFMVFLWLWHNIQVSRSLTGPRPAPMWGLADCLEQAREMMVNWFGFGDGYLVLVIMLCSAIGIWFLWKGWRFEKDRQKGKWLVSLALFVIVYLIIIIPSFSILDNKPVLDRYLAPIFIPILIIVFYLFESLRKSIHNRFLFYALPIFWLVFLIPVLPNTIGLFNTRADAFSTSFSIYSLQDSALVKNLHGLVLPDLPLYSNCQRCLYIYDNIHPAVIFDEDRNNKPYMPSSSRDLPAVLVWFNNVSPGKENLPPPRPLPDMNKLLGLPVKVKPILETEDGGVYQLLEENQY